MYQLSWIVVLSLCSYTKWFYLITTVFGEFEDDMLLCYTLKFFPVYLKVLQISSQKHFFYLSLHTQHCTQQNMTHNIMFMYSGLPFKDTRWR